MRTASKCSGKPKYPLSCLLELFPNVAFKTIPMFQNVQRCGAFSFIIPIQKERCANLSERKSIQNKNKITSAGLVFPRFFLPPDIPSKPETEAFASDSQHAPIFSALAIVLHKFNNREDKTHTHTPKNNNKKQQHKMANSKWISAAAQVAIKGKPRCSACNLHHLSGGVGVEGECRNRKIKTPTDRQRDRHKNTDMNLSASSSINHQHIRVTGDGERCNLRRDVCS